MSGGPLRGVERIRRALAAAAAAAREGELRTAARAAALRHRLAQLEEAMPATPRAHQPAEERNSENEEEERETLRRVLHVLHEYGITDSHNAHESIHGIGGQEYRVNRAAFDAVNWKLLRERRTVETSIAELENAIASLKTKHESLSQQCKRKQEKFAKLNVEKLYLRDRIAAYDTAHPGP